MNLATRCTACGTIFRVVQDQLRVSEGWVRCGRCAEVFDAREQLFDLERDTPPPWPPHGQEPQPPAPAHPPHQQHPQHPQPALPPAPAPMAFAPAPVPDYAPEPPPAARPAHVPPAPDTTWTAPQDDEALNPFAPPRVTPDDDAALVEEFEREFGPSRLPQDTRARGPLAEEDRVEPFLDAPAPPPDPRSDLPEPKGMRFPEDETPPPDPDDFSALPAASPASLPDDDRPDVLLSLSPAHAAHVAQASAQAGVSSTEPGFAAEPSAAPSKADKATDKSADKTARKAEEKAAKAAQKEAVQAAKAAAAAEKAAAKEAAAAEKAAARAAKAGEDAALPSFMRQAESAQRWHRPGMRLGLSILSVVLLVLLLAQGLWLGRAALAAHYPGTRPALQAMSQAMGQDLQPWRHIEALSVESSGLNPAGGSGNHYRFSLSLRNGSNWEVAHPWVDLSLTDPTGQVLVRRMLSPTELQGGKPSIAGGADQQLQLVFSSGNQKISGYTVELFYP